MLPLIPAAQSAQDVFSSTTPLSPFGGALTSGASQSVTSYGASFGTTFGDALASAASSATASAGAISPATGVSSEIAMSGIASTSAPFSDLLVQSVTQVNQLERAAQTSIEGLLSGKGVDVHEAMIATEKAEMGFDMAVAVRDKALSAYQQVMSMQF